MFVRSKSSSEQVLSNTSDLKRARSEDYGGISSSPGLRYDLATIRTRRRVESQFETGCPQTGVLFARYLYRLEPRSVLRCAVCAAFIRNQSRGRVRLKPIPRRGQKLYRISTRR